MTTEPSIRQLIDESVRQCIPGAKGLGSRDDSLSQLSKGATNAMYRVHYLVDDGTEKRAILRILRESAGSVLESPTAAQVEAEVIRAACSAGVVAPGVLGILPSGSPLGIGFFSEWLDGETLGNRIATAPEFEQARQDGRLGRQCGVSIARLQKVDVSRLHMGADSAELPGNKAADLDGLWHAYAHIGICKPALDYTFAWLKAKKPLEEQGDASVLVHGDFRNGNLLVDPKEGLIGVLDWEMTHVGSRYEDLGWLCVPSWRYSRHSMCVGGFADVEHLCSGYEAESGCSVDRAALRWWTLFGSLKWAMLCLGMGAGFVSDPSRLEHAVVARRTSEAELDCLVMIANMTNPEGAAGILRRALRSDPEVGGARSESPSRFPDDSLLIEAVRAFLVAQVVPALAGAGHERQAFMGRVAANALSMVTRGLQKGPESDAREKTYLSKLLGRSEDSHGSADLTELRKEFQVLVHNKSRDDKTLIESQPELLQQLLRQAVLHVLIDQPKYAGLAPFQSSL